uniref:Ankyrin repeat protein n=1 Tax=Clandestinovirus TaxID=2831644 RepID=A0A8F8PK90_9VIRU|nr:ankyrin repeat protein [Clandestinovirus]
MQMLDETLQTSKVKIQYIPQNLSYPKVGYILASTNIADIRLLSVEFHPDPKTIQFQNLLKTIEKMILDFLLEDEKLGRNISASLTDGSTRLHWISLLPFIKLAEFWLKHIAVDIADNYGTTPLYVAALNSNSLMYNYLVQRGANPRKEHPLTHKTPEEVLKSRLDSLFIEVPKDLKRAREETEVEPELHPKKAQRRGSFQMLTYNQLPLEPLALSSIPQPGYTTSSVPSSPLAKLALSPSSPVSFGATSPAHFSNASSPRGSSTTTTSLSPRNFHHAPSLPPSVLKPVGIRPKSPMLTTHLTNLEETKPEPHQ